MYVTNKKRGSRKDAESEITNVVRHIHTYITSLG